MAQAVRRKNSRLRLGLIVGVVVLLVVLLAAALPFILAKPELTLSGEQEMQLPYQQEYTEPGIQATLRGKDISDRIKVEGSVDPSVLGDYELTYSVEYQGKTYSEKRMVHVADLEAPVVTLNGEETVSVGSIEEFRDAGAAAMDNYDGDLSSAIQTKLVQQDDYTYEQTYSVLDSSGNEGTAVRQIVIVDVTAPVITLNGDASMTIKQGESFTDPGATAEDDRDGDLSASIQTEGYVDPQRVDTYTITYTVKDAAGNEGKTVRRVTVASTQGNSESRIYLTFDDGPSADVTPRILDILKENNIKATFFICNYSDKNKHLVQRMVDEGHTIGIHGYSHEYSEIYTSTDAFMENIYKLRDKVKEDTGYEAFIIRFPGGSSNTISRKYCSGIMTKLVQMVTDQGLLYLDWNVDSNDATGNNKPKDYLVESATSGLKQNRTNVVLMHDISTKKTTADALQEIIDYGKQNGYTFYACSPDMTVVHHGVNN